MSVTPPTPPPLPPQPAGGAPDPDPRPVARPLDRAEERSLSALEQQLRHSDPELDSEMTSLDSTGGAVPGAGALGSADRVLQATAIGVIVLVVVPGEWLGGILSFGLLLGVPLVMALIAVRAHRENTGQDPDDDRGTGREGDRP